ncbi:hypothetical protein jhhlp_000145 [Lomentospora prolificans]|uniref:Tyrosinase copper-binding domain-containing protein n=1 Tax=Lomentospora prolificans TaxID=41688 RepID=A0A2N3NLQ7_9PEZI|nr:hypothetical protein jhhlp_000145 [Lomentospora prolificans]
MFLPTFLCLMFPDIFASYCPCINPPIRKEWRTLSKGERVQYIDAVKCLMEKPPLMSQHIIPGVTSRYEDFLGIHIVQADEVHFTGGFYPYHRLLLYLYEQELHTCGWPGGVPYWDWTLDNANSTAFFNSPLFDDETGFGGNGKYIPGNVTHPANGVPPRNPDDFPDRTGGGCIQSGPFANLTTHLGPGNSTDLNPHCVRRDFSPESFANRTGKAQIDDGMAQLDFGSFGRLTEPSFHAGGHWGIGGLYGDMTDKWSSPADPLFYLHHANVDRAWWSWQSRDLENRTMDISGPLIAFDFDNKVAGNLTLDHDMSLGVTNETTIKVKVQDVMHIQRGRLCYNYDKLY